MFFLFLQPNQFPLPGILSGSSSAEDGATELFWLLGYVDIVSLSMLNV